MQNVVLEVSRTRDFQTLVQRATVLGNSHQFAEPLPSGVLYWRVTSSEGQSATWEVFIPHADADVLSESPPVFDVDGDGSGDLVHFHTASADFVTWDARWIRYVDDRFVVDQQQYQSTLPARTIASFTFAGDFNGDGFADVLEKEPLRLLVIGGRPLTDGARVFVRLGSPSGLRPRELVALVEHGRLSRFTIAGDLNHDGFSDLQGILRFDTSSAMPEPTLMVLYGGPSPRLEMQTRLPNAQLNEYEGEHWLSPVGDTDGDGNPDVAITVHSLGLGREWSNRFWIYHGDGHGFSATPEEVAVPSTLANAVQIIFPVGDINGDGRVDLGLSSAASHETGIRTSERVGVLLGHAATDTQATWLWLDYPTDLRPNEPFLMTPLGDINSDGLDDFAGWRFYSISVYLGTRTTSRLQLLQRYEQPPLPMARRAENLAVGTHVSRDNLGRVLFVQETASNPEGDFLLVRRSDPMTGRTTLSELLQLNLGNAFGVLGDALVF